MSEIFLFVFFVCLMFLICHTVPTVSLLPEMKCICKSSSLFCIHHTFIQYLICLTISYFRWKSLTLQLSRKNKIQCSQPGKVKLCSCHLDYEVAFCFRKPKMIYSFNASFSFLSDKNCSMDIDECAFKPCKNGGYCQDLIGEFYCSCLPGR